MVLSGTVANSPRVAPCARRSPLRPRPGTIAARSRPTNRAAPRQRERLYSRHISDAFFSFLRRVFTPATAAADPKAEAAALKCVAELLDDGIGAIVVRKVVE